MGGATASACRSLIRGQAGFALRLRGPLLGLLSPLWLPSTLVLGQAPGPVLWALTTLPSWNAPQSPATPAFAPLPGAKASFPPAACPARLPYPAQMSALVPPSRLPRGSLHSSVSPSVLLTSHLWTLIQLPLHEAPPPRDPLLTSAGGGAVTGKGSQAAAGNVAHSGGLRGASYDQTPLTARSGGRQPRSWESRTTGGRWLAWGGWQPPPGGAPSGPSAGQGAAPSSPPSSLPPQPSAWAP